MMKCRKLKEFSYSENSKEFSESQSLSDYGFQIPRPLNVVTEKVTKMANIKDMAEGYVSPETKNIAELEKVSVELDVKNKVVNQGTPDEFNYNYILVAEEEYRVPNIVLKQLKTILEANDKVKHFKVIKKGEGLKTDYLVMAL